MQDPEIECRNLYQKTSSLARDVTCRMLSPHLRTQMRGTCSQVPVIALTYRGVYGVAFAYRPAVPIVSASKQESRCADVEAGWAIVHTSRSSLGLVKEMLIGATAGNSTSSYV